MTLTRTRLAIAGYGHDEHRMLGDVEQLVRSRAQDRASDRVFAVGADDDRAGTVLGRQRHERVDRSFRDQRERGVDTGLRGALHRRLRDPLAELPHLLAVGGALLAVAARLVAEAD